MAEPRSCLYVDETMHTPKGYIPSFVTEDEAGHSPMIGSGPLAQPWYFGDDIDTAKRLVDQANAEIGISPQDMLEIVASSMRASVIDRAAIARRRERLERTVKGFSTAKIDAEIREFG